MNNSSVAAAGFSPAFRKELIACYVFKYIIGLIGGVSNLFLIIVCCMQRNTLSSGIKWLVVQYSFAYFCISLIMYPVRDTMIMGMQFQFTVPLAEYCPHFATANTICWAVANWTEVCLAFNRFVAICFPHQYEIMKRQRTIFGSMLFAWTLSFVVVLPATYTWPGRIVSKAATAQCSILQAGPASYFVTSWETFVSYALTGILSASILLKAASMHRHRQQVGDLNTAERRQMKTHRRRMKLAFMLVASFGWNCLCNMPFLVITMGMSSMFSKYPSLSLWVRLLRSVQVALSPVVFFVFNEDYRRTGKELIGKCCRIEIQRADHQWGNSGADTTALQIKAKGTDSEPDRGLEKI